MIVCWYVFLIMKCPIQWFQLLCVHMTMDDVPEGTGSVQNAATVFYISMLHVYIVYVLSYVYDMFIKSVFDINQRIQQIHNGYTMHNIRLQFCLW